MPNSTPQKRPGSTARGLGHDHQQNRDRLFLRHVDGTPCWWCGLKMWRDPTRNPDGRALHADHSRSRSQYGKTGNIADRLMHASCNESRGDGSRDHLRPALHGGAPAATHAGVAAVASTIDPLGPRPYFAWPD